MPGRIMAIDFGLKRLGVAVSDPLGAVAQGLPTIERKNIAADLSAVGALIEKYSVREIVLGHPLSKDGSANAMSVRVEEFAAKLRKRVSCPVRLQDERLTSAEAERVLRESGVSLAKRRRAVDQVAATLILEGYLDRQAYASRGDVDKP
ncbi:MAG: Holliday junction resolvase RuvX [Terriglobia bacterium]